MKFTTLISGFNTADVCPCDASENGWVADYTASQAWMNAHHVQIHVAGRATQANIAKIAARKGIVRGLRAEATSFDSSGKCRHVTVVLAA